MIHKIYSNNSSFQCTTFKKGLNVIVGEKSENSDKKNTRNGVGKTTLLRVINFCLGSDGTGLPVDHLNGWEFSIEMDLFEERIIASRSVDNKKEIKIQGNVKKFPPINFKITPNNKYKCGIEDWKVILSKGLFNFEKNNDIKYNPSFRNLIQYFHRLGSEAYDNPFKTLKRVSPFQWQIPNAFLLNLKWEDASEAQEIKDEDKLIKNIKKSYNEHFLKDVSGKTFLKSKGQLETEKIKLKSRVNRNNENLSKFKINDKYKDIEKRANSLSKNLSSLSDEKFILERKLSQYNESIMEEEAEEFNLEQIYIELNYHLPNSVKKTIHDAKEFHNSIIKNRKNFLDVEINRIKNKIKELDEKINYNNQDLSKTMSILNSSIALDLYNSIIEEKGEDENKLEEINIRLDQINSINKRENDLKLKKSEFEKVIERDYEESKPEREKAIKIFDKCSYALYDESGSLIIDANCEGYSFDVKIPKGNSDGIKKMKIFCYDLTLIEIQSKKDNIDFLIHDSNIFYGVDKRQRANGLEYIAQKAIESNFQHICTINEDDIPFKEFSEDFDIGDYIVRRLKDNDPKETALGFYYD